MTDGSGVNMFEVIADKYESRCVEAHRLSCEHRNADSARLAWFVAICGYVLINGARFLASALPPVTLAKVGVLFGPWAAAAILAVLAHIAIVSAAGDEDKYHLGRLAALDNFWFSIAEGSPNGAFLQSIVDGSEPRLKSLQCSMDRSNRRRTVLTQSAQWAVVVSLGWSVIALVFNQCLIL